MGVYYYLMQNSQYKIVSILKAHCLKEILECIFLDRMLFFNYIHVGILLYIMYITTCYEGILHKYLVFIIRTTLKAKEAIKQNIYLNACI